MDLVQLVSFGCGVDAITTDETREILQAGGKLYTQLKIDEITNLGAVRIRLRSLFAALDEQDEEERKGDLSMELDQDYPRFTPEMKKTHKILIPNMAPVQFRILAAVMEQPGLPRASCWKTAAARWRSWGSSTSITTPATRPCWSSASSWTP